MGGGAGYSFWALLLDQRSTFPGLIPPCALYPGDAGFYVQSCDWRNHYAGEPQCDPITVSCTFHGQRILCFWSKGMPRVTLVCREARMCVASVCVWRGDWRACVHVCVCLRWGLCIPEWPARHALLVEATLRWSHVQVLFPAVSQSYVDV